LEYLGHLHVQDAEANIVKQNQHHEGGLVEMPHASLMGIDDG
jgi:hypothetical protein